MALPHYSIESLGPVLTRRNNKLLHRSENKQAILNSDWRNYFVKKNQSDRPGLPVKHGLRCYAI